jgi:hypothetical protein
VRLPHNLSMAAQRLILRVGLLPPIHFYHQAFEAIRKMSPREFVEWEHTSTGFLVQRTLMAEHPVIAETAAEYDIGERDVVASAVAHAVTGFDGTGEFNGVRVVDFGGHIARREAAIMALDERPEQAPATYRPVS